MPDYQKNSGIRAVGFRGARSPRAGRTLDSGPDTGPGPGSGDGGPTEIAFLGCPQETAQAPDGRIWFHNQFGSRRFRTLTRVPF